MVGDDGLLLVFHCGFGVFGRNCEKKRRCGWDGLADDERTICDRQTHPRAARFVPFEIHSAKHFRAEQAKRFPFFFNLFLRQMPSAIVLVVAVIVLVVAAYALLRTMPSSPHLGEHVLLTVDQRTNRPHATVIFHPNGMGLRKDLRHKRPTWTPCSYTWQHQTLTLRDPAHPSAPRRIRFDHVVEVPDQGLDGYASDDPRKKVTHYLWKVAPSRTPALVGKRIAFAPTTPSLPFDAFTLQTTRRVECEKSGVRTSHLVRFRAALPSTSRWTCALYMRGGKRAAWKTATVRLAARSKTADVQWKDNDGLFHVVSRVPWVER